MAVFFITDIVILQYQNTIEGLFYGILCNQCSRSKGRCW